MATGVLGQLALDRLSASRVWGALPPEMRAEAARALYAGEHDDPAARRLADAAIAAALRFREVAVQKLPLERRVAHLSRLQRPDESLATSLLLALHLGSRRPMLAAFLDALGIAHENGAIRDAESLGPPPAEALSRACGALAERFPPGDVEVYLASLLALDPDTWGGLAAILGVKSRHPTRDT
jgi:hypothetical protein